jgi:hypothetical protein
VDLAQHGADVLSVVVGVASAAAVAHRRVEEAVGAEGELPAVVVPELRVRDDDQDPLRRRVGFVGVGAHREARDHDVAVVARRRRGVRDGSVEDEEEAVGLVLGVEREAQQAALAAGQDPVADVEEPRACLRARRPHDRALEEEADASCLLDDEQAVRVVAGVGESDRADQPRGPLEDVRGLGPRVRHDPDAGKKHRQPGDQRAPRHAPSISHVPSAVASLWRPRPRASQPRRCNYGRRNGLRRRDQSSRSG